MSAASPLDSLAPDACLCRQIACVCLDAERALRLVMAGRSPMTSDQRAWCLDEIARVEGYRRTDHEHEPDQDLAHTVLCAWTDYARDKGLL